MKDPVQTLGGFITPKRVGLVIGAFFALIIIMSYWPFRSVPVGSRGVVTQFGAIKGIEQEGLSLVWPWQKLAIFNIRAEKADIQDAAGVTSDQQRVDTDLTIRYSISPSQVAMVYEQYSHNGDLQDYVQTATQEVFKAVTAKYTAPDLVAKRAEVSAEVKAALETKLKVYGAQVLNIDMRAFSWSKEYADAINRKVTQEQERLVADNKLLTVESEQKQKVAIAEAEANAVKAKADGDKYQVEAAADADAYTKLTVATAEAEALTAQNKALSQNKDVLELRRIEVQMKFAENWKGDVPTAMYGSGPIPFIQGLGVQGH